MRHVRCGSRLLLAFADCQCRGYRRMMSDQLDWKLAVKKLRINSMLAAAIIRQKSKIRQSRTLRQSISTRVRLIPNSAYVRKLYVPFVFLTNLESEDDDHRSCLSPIIADIVRSPRWRPGCLGFSFALRRPFRSHSTSYSKWHLQTGDVTNL